MAGNDTKKEIIRTTIILTAITIFEFIIAFTWTSIFNHSESSIMMRNALYGVLTLFKAFFIVSVFMHLGGEVRRLALTIVLPFVFILWLIIGLVLEGGYWGNQDKKTMQSSAAPAQVEAITIA